MKIFLAGWVMISLVSAQPVSQKGSGAQPSSPKEAEDQPANKNSLLDAAIAGMDLPSIKKEGEAVGGDATAQSPAGSANTTIENTTAEESLKQQPEK
jgi:hypothetical protein